VILLASTFHIWFVAPVGNRFMAALLGNSPPSSRRRAGGGRHGINVELITGHLFISRYC
jgi:hypothetical protein